MFKRRRMWVVIILLTCSLKLLFLTGCSSMNSSSDTNNSSLNSSSIISNSSIFMISTTVGADTIRYINNTGAPTIESASQYPMPRNLIVKTFTINVSSATISGNTIITIRKNGLNTPISLIITPNSSGVFASTSSTTFNKNDLLSIKVDTTGSSGGITAVISFEMQ